jgi:hypothetical protein
LSGGAILRTAKARATTKYRDLSTAAAKAPPSVEMTFVGWESREGTAKAKAKYRDPSLRSG